MNSSMYLWFTLLWSVGLAALIPDHTCIMSASDNCDLKNYAVGDIVLVIPLGNTKCQEGSSVYSFIYRKGRQDKVLLQFQGMHYHVLSNVYFHVFVNALFFV
jgi:hypothetical protein